MKNIKWIGIIKGDMPLFETVKLDDKAKKLNMPSMEKMMIKALPFIIPSLIILNLSVFVKRYLSNEAIMKPVFLAFGLAAGIVCLLLHELLHAIVYPKNAAVYIGIYPKAAAAVALASYPLKKTRFIIMSLLPYILGIVPLVLFWIMPPEYKGLNGFLFGMACIGLISPYPDSFNVCKVCRQTPKNCELQFYEDGLYWIEE